MVGTAPPTHYKEADGDVGAKPPLSVRLIRLLRTDGAFFCQAVDEGGDVACAEAVVDVDDGDVCGTTVQHT